jgi:hypothetical protein
MRPSTGYRMTRFTLVFVLVGPLLALRAAAQEHPVPEGTPLPPYARVLSPEDELGLQARLATVNNVLPNVMLTGYWPPTNEMLRQFSPNPAQNPGGWVGENWEGRGYNIYAFFPEFPQGLGKGVGDLEVDYQDTSADFWRIAAEVRPVVVMTFGRAGDDYLWEVEYRQRNLPSDSWFADYLAPLRPTPAPPDGAMPQSYVRWSSLPVLSIVDAVNNAAPGVLAFHDAGFCGAFLCEYIAYHACWYHDLHAERSDPLWVGLAGHTHVGGYVGLQSAIQSTEITLRTVLEHMDAQFVVRGDLDCDGTAGFGDINSFVVRLSNAAAYRVLYPRCLEGNGDINGDGLVDFGDINPFVALLAGNVVE